MESPLAHAATWTECSRAGYGAGLTRLSGIGDESGRRNAAALERSDNVADWGHAFAGLKRGYLLTMATKVAAASRRWLEGKAAGRRFHFFGAAGGRSCGHARAPR